MNAADEPNPKLVELSALLVGTWRVHGPDIKGQAEYQSKNEGRLLVAFVDFSVGHSIMRVIQHIAYDADRDMLLARYMDTMGDAAIYAWELDGRKMRVSPRDGASDAYFQATVNEDNSQFTGSWHYPGAASADPAEAIVYTRMDTTEASIDASTALEVAPPSHILR